MLPEISILDGNFAHHPESMTHGKSARYFKWNRENKITSKSCFITDNFIHRVDKCNADRKVGMLIEPPAINPSIYSFCKEHYKKFDYILTFDKELLDMGKNFLFFPFGVCWIKDYTKPKKNKMCSMIASDKRFTPGHDFRQLVIQRFADKVDHYGRGFTYIENKEDGLRDYYFSIVIENSRTDYYFSEKIIDCFASRTIPIYWGSNVSSFFDMSGIITFNTIDDLEKIVNNLSADYYKTFAKAMENNFNLICEKDFEIPEDWIYKHYPFLIN